MPPRLVPPLQLRDERDDKIRRLEDDLYMARQHILDLAPKELHEILHSYHFCTTRVASLEWEEAVIESVLDAAEPLSETPYSAMFGARAYCPLCRRGAQSYYSEDGFAFPEGLRRHLVGYGRTRICFVIEAAIALARDGWDRKFFAAEKELEYREQAAKQARKATETLYVLGPRDGPLLVDEQLFWKGARAADGADFSMMWAEQRLFALGFKINVDGRQRSYTKTVSHDGIEFVIYADPRRIGEIGFRVFDVSAARGKRAGLPLATFRLRDQWKNGLPEKVAAGVEKAATSMRR